MKAFKTVLSVVLIFAVITALSACGTQKSFVTPVFGTRAMKADDFSEVVLGCTDYEKLTPYFARIDISDDSYGLIRLSDYSCTLAGGGFDSELGCFEKEYSIFLGDISFYIEHGKFISDKNGVSFYRLENQLLALMLYSDEKNGAAVVADIPDGCDETALISDITEISGRVSLCGKLPAGIEITAYSADEVRFFNGWKVKNLNQLFWDETSCYFVCSSNGTPFAAVTAYMCGSQDAEQIKSGFEQDGTFIAVYNEKGREAGFTSTSFGTDNSRTYYIKSGDGYICLLINASGVIDVYNWPQTEAFLNGG